MTAPATLDVSGNWIDSAGGSFVSNGGTVVFNGGGNDADRSSAIR